MADNVVEFVIEGKDKFSGAFTSLGRSITSVGGLLTGLATGALARATTQALEFGSTIKDTAERVDFSTNALQEWRFVAEQSGASAEKMDTALGMFSRTLGQAAAGSDEAQKALDRVGVSLNDINTLSPEQIFERTRDSISQLGSAAQRNQSLMQLFGRQGKELGNVFAESSTDIAKMRSEAEQLGAVMTEKTIAAAKKTKDELDAMTNVIKTQLSTALITVGPLLVKAAELLAGMAKKAAEATEAFAFFLGLKPETDPYDKLLQKFTSISDEIARVKASGGLPNAMGPVDKYLENLNAALAETQAQLENMRKATAAKTEGGDVKKNKVDQDYLRTLQVQYDAAFGLKLKQLQLERDAELEKINKMNLRSEDAAAARYLVDESYERRRFQLQMDTAEKLKGMGQEYSMVRIQQLEEELARMRELKLADIEIDRYAAATRLQIQADEITARYAAETAALEAKLVLSQTMSDREKQIARDALRFEQMNDAQKVVSQRDAFGQMLSDLGTFNKTAFSAFKAYATGVALIDTWTSFTKTLAAYPYPFNIIPAAASLAAGLAKVNAIRGQQYSGAAHGGMTEVPSESTFLLNKGERVLSPNQNRDLTDFLASGQGGGVNVGTLNITIAVPDSRALRDMDRNDWRNITAEKIVPALDALDAAGIRQRAFERQRGV